MGLGPRVCKKCLVIYEFKHSYGWECPICKTNNPDHLNLWEMGDDLIEITKKLKANKHFYDFMLNKEQNDEASIDGKSQ